MLGEQIGSYRIVRELGRGGMGTVFLAEHALLGSPAAVKVLLPALSQDQEIVSRFFNEARAATQIRHPGIVEVYDFGYHVDGSAFLVMEFLEGESLESRLAHQGRLAVAQAVPIIRQVCSALAAAHAKGIVHRDLKPDNIFVVRDPDIPGGERIKLLDFGIAKLAGDASPQELKTRTGAVMGTPMYMSPEQCRGASQLDARADLYSLGCILFRVLCGRTPFVGEYLGDILAAHMRDPAPTVRSLDPNLPPAMDTLVGRLLAKSPDDRYSSAADLGADLESVLANGSQRNPTPPLGSEPTLRPMPLPTQPVAAVHTPAPFATAPPPDTTLRAAAGTRTQEPRPRSRRSGFWLGTIGAAVVIAGAVVAIVLASGNDETVTLPNTRAVTVGVHSQDTSLVAGDFELVLDADDFPRAPATAVVPFVDSDLSLAMVVVVESSDRWMGNDSYTSDPSDQLVGAYSGLVPALRQLSTAGPRDTRRSLITYSSQVQTRLAPTPGGDLVAALGEQRDYQGQIGASLIAALDEATRELAEQRVDQRLLVVFGSGQGMREDISADVRRVGKRLAELDALVFTVGYTPWVEDNPVNAQVLKVLGRTGAFASNSRDELALHARGIADYLTGDYFVTFNVPKELSRSERWVGLEVRGDERPVDNLSIASKRPIRLSAADREPRPQGEKSTSGEPTATPPTIASGDDSAARVIDVKPAAGRSIITVNRGKADGVDRGATGYLVHSGTGKPLPGGRFKVIKVTTKTSVGKVAIAVDQVRANDRVEFEGLDEKAGHSNTSGRPPADGSAASGSIQAPENPGAASGDADKLLVEARNAAKAGQFGKALSLCRRSLKLRESRDAAMVCAIAACNLKNASQAKRFSAKLGASRANMVRQICLRNGVDF